MNKLAITFIILIIIGVAIEAALLLKIFKIPTDLSFFDSVNSREKTVKLENIAPSGGQVVNISITESGFVPTSIKVKLGDKIIWTNNTTGSVDLRSEDHPTHELYPFLNLGVAEPNKTLRLIFRQIGTFTYHNHLIPSQKGTIVVE